MAMQTAVSRADPAGDAADGRMTDEAYWRDFWEGFEPDIVPEDFHSPDLMEIVEPYLAGMPAGKTCIEIGGFPGRNMIHAAKYWGFQCSLLDLVIDRDVIHQLEAANDLPTDTITAIRADVADVGDPALGGAFDLVTSGGFIEHFQNPKAVLERHLHFLKPGGVLLVTLPNLRGVTGAMLRLFARDEFDTHNLVTMDPDLLGRIADELGLVDIKSFAFYEDAAIFLPADQKFKCGWRRLAFLPVRAASKVLERLKIPSPFFAPHICLLARKPV